MISLNQLSMQLGGRILYSDVNLNLNAGKRYAVVGANGTGKSTLLSLLSGIEQPSLGEINMAKKATIGWLKQDQFRYENDRIIDVVFQGKPALWQAWEEKEDLLTQPTFDEASGHRLAQLEEIIADHNGYVADSFAAQLLVGLGIGIDYHDKPLSALSGGYKLRALLAQVLFQEPDILLLDEPTNHLDIMTTDWLEEYLKSQHKGVLIFISHDREFLNHLSTHTLDIDYGEIREYVGHYDQAMKQKEVIEEQKLHAQAHVEKKIADMQKFIDRFGAKATKAKQASSRKKMIERLELPDIQTSSRIAPTFDFPIQRQSGKRVLKVSKLSKAYGDKKVLCNVSSDIHRGEKVALVGHNGVGKSTFLKAALGLVHADEGQVEWGHESQISYFAQDHHELLKTSMTLMEWLADQCSKATTVEIRKMLGRVLFSDDDVYKNVLNISGGEAARLLLAKNMLEQGNVLILDEPTNHMDLETIEALIHALKKYQGTLIFVSHDRYFVSRIANRLLILTEQGVKDFKGSYQEYIASYGHDYLNKVWLQQNA